MALSNTAWFLVVKDQSRIQDLVAIRLRATNALVYTTAASEEKLLFEIWNYYWRLSSDLDTAY